MNKLNLILVGLLVVALFGGCAVENKVISTKTWNATPTTISIKSPKNVSGAGMDEFVTSMDTWLEKMFMSYEYKVTPGTALQLSYTVDQFEPGNKWLRMVAGVFGAGQGMAKGKVYIKKSGSLIGSYEYEVIQRGGLLGGSISDMAREAAYGIARKIDKKEFDESLFEHKK